MAVKVNIALNIVSRRPGTYLEIRQVVSLALHIYICSKITAPLTLKRKGTVQRKRTDNGTGTPLDVR